MRPSKKGGAMHQFWRSWLDIWCFLVIVSGGLLAGITDERVKGPIIWLLKNIEPSIELSFSETERFGIGIIGVMTIALGLALFYLIRAAHKYGRPLWRQIALTAMVWYGLGGYISYSTGFELKIVSNAVLMVTLLMPLYASRKL